MRHAWPGYFSVPQCPLWTWPLLHYPTPEGGSPWGAAVGGHISEGSLGQCELGSEPAILREPAHALVPEGQRSAFG